MKSTKAMLIAVVLSVVGMNASFALAAGASCEAVKCGQGYLANICEDKSCGGCQLEKGQNTGYCTAH